MLILRVMEHISCKLNFNVIMKKYLAILLIVIGYSTYSQTNENNIPITNLPDPNIPVRTLQDVRNEELNYNSNYVQNRKYDKALDEVTPIDGIENDNSDKETIYSLTMKEANKLKMVDYSNVRPSDVYTTNEDGTRTANGDTYNTTTGEAYNEETANEQHYNSHSSFGEKLLKIVGLIIGWFAIGFVINVFFYAGKPDYLLGKSNTAKSLHIILNIITVIVLVFIIVS